MTIEVINLIVDWDRHETDYQDPHPELLMVGAEKPIA